LIFSVKSSSENSSVDIRVDIVNPAYVNCLVKFQFH